MSPLAAPAPTVRYPIHGFIPCGTAPIWPEAEVVSTLH